MLNQCVLIGRLTRDPELRYTPSGVPVASFTLAVDRSYTTQDGQRETDFLDIIAWRKLAETVSAHLTKGRLVAVSGSVQTRSYETPEGQRRKVWEVNAHSIRYLDRKNDSAAPGNDMGTEVDVNQDDIPF